jgi:hypothetical protein
MKLAGFGSPSDIIKDLLAGTYQPRIKPGSIKRSSILHNIWRKDYLRQEQNILATGISEEDMEEVLNWTPVLPENEEYDGSGEISVEGFDEKIKKEVELHLQSLAAHLHERLGDRLKILPLNQSSMAAFGGNLLWVESETWKDQAWEKLEKVFDDLTGVAKDGFELDSCFPPYLMFLKFSSRQFAAQSKISPEKVWRAFWSRYQEEESFQNVIDLFEFIQIKSYSEAIAETVGRCVNTVQQKLHPSKNYPTFSILTISFII